MVTQPRLLWPQAHPPTHPWGFGGQDVPSLFRRGSCGTLLPAVSCSSPCLLCKAKSPSPEPALSGTAQILPLVPEVISILMEIPLYGLSPVVLIQCPRSNAFHSPLRMGIQPCSAPGGVSATAVPTGHGHTL